MNILVSSCLLGINCKYNGENNFSAKVKELENYYNLIPVCPEVLGGLEIPRMPSEILDKKVINCKNIDVTKEFNKDIGTGIVLCMIREITPIDEHNYFVPIEYL